MSSPFVTGDRFPVNVRYTVKKLDSGASAIVVLKTDEEVKKVEEGGKKVETIRTQWVQANWKQSHELIRAATIWDENAGVRDVDFQKYRYMVLENQMVAWDIKTDKGEPVPVSKENIALLAPAIASALIEGYTASTSMTEKEMGE